MKAIAVSRKKETFDDICTRLEKQSISSQWIGKGSEALSKITTDEVHLVIVEDQLPDTGGRGFVEQLVMANPGIYCVVQSDLSSSVFHETYEGLGVLMQLSLPVDEEQVDALLTRLERIEQLAKKTDDP